MRLVLHMGSVYQLSNRAYERALRAIANGQDAPTWTELKAKRLGRIDADTTDMGRLDAADRLDALPLTLNSKRSRCERCAACQEWLLSPDSAPPCSQRKRKRVAK